MPSQPPKFLQIRLDRSYVTEGKIVHHNEELEGLTETYFPTDRPGDAIYQLVGTLEVPSQPMLKFVPVTKEEE